MGDTNRAPFVFVSTTFTMPAAAGVVQKNIRVADLPGAQLDRIPPRLRNSLRGTIEFMSIVQKTVGGAGRFVEVMFFGTDQYLVSAAVTQVDFLGTQKFIGADWEISPSNTHNVVDAENMGIFYRDKDNTGEFHVRIEANADGAGQATDARLQFVWRPEIGIP